MLTALTNQPAPPASVRPGRTEPRAAGLARLLQAVAATDYRFITSTPLTQQRVLHHRGLAAGTTLRDIFGLSLPFHSASVATDLLALMDRFDPFCDHLRVSSDADNGVTAGTLIGTYRVLPPQAARRAGGLYIDTEFDLAPLSGLRRHAVELGRSCVHPTGVLAQSSWRCGKHCFNTRSNAGWTP